MLRLVLCLQSDLDLLQAAVLGLLADRGKEQGYMASRTGQDGVREARAPRPTVGKVNGHSFHKTLLLSLREPFLDVLRFPGSRNFKCQVPREIFQTQIGSFEPVEPFALLLSVETNSTYVFGIPCWQHSEILSTCIKKKAYSTARIAPKEF